MTPKGKSSFAVGPPNFVEWSRERGQKGETGSRSLSYTPPLVQEIPARVPVRFYVLPALSAEKES